MNEDDKRIPEDMEETKDNHIEKENECKETAETDKKQKKNDKRIQALETALETAQKERDDFKDKYVHTFSDYNNYKKRSLTAAATANRDGQGEVIQKILPVLDSFERALAPMEEKQEDAFVKGMFMVLRQLSDLIAGFGVKEIPALGEAFDPNLHQAISLKEAEEGQASGIVTDVMQKGYSQGDKVLRHSMVTVSK